MLSRLFFITFLHFTAIYGGQDLPKIETPGMKDPKLLIQYQLKTLEQLKLMTTQTLQQITEFESQIKNYQTIQELYLQNPKDKEVLFRMAKMADQLLKKIKTTNMTHVFDTEFIKELNLFSKIYRKHDLSKRKD